MNLVSYLSRNKVKTIRMFACSHELTEGQTNILTAVCQYLLPIKDPKILAVFLDYPVDEKSKAGILQLKADYNLSENFRTPFAVADCVLSFDHGHLYGQLNGDKHQTKLYL